MTKEQVVELMKSSKNEQEWNNNCDKVKKVFYDYPNWWFAEIIMSGVAARTQASW